MARPRSAEAHKKVLDAAVQLFSERGIDSTSMDAIAEVSGVSKATIYKHWQDKNALCLEVMGYLHGLDEEQPVFDSGDLRADLIAQLQYQPAADRQALREKVRPHMIAYASRNRAMGAVWRARIVEPARTALTNIIKRGEKRGILRHGIDPEVGIAILLGPMIYRHIFVTKTGGKAPKDLEIHVVDAFLAAFGTEKRKPAHR
jgi:AcrR family transcriptional regulator